MSDKELAKQWMDETGWILYEMPEDLVEGRTDYESLLEKFKSACYVLSEISGE